MSNSDVHYFNINNYVGAPPFSVRSADGSIYILVVGTNSAGQFGTLVYRYANGSVEPVQLEVFSQYRSSWSVEADGLYVTTPISENQIARYKVPGFIPPTSVVQTQTGDVPQVDH